MDRTDQLAFLKLHFGTLFLTTYHMPTLDEVKNVIGSGVFLFARYFPFVSIGCILRSMIEKLLKRGEELIMFSKNNFLRDFNANLETYDTSIVPLDTARSPLTFFKTFFEPEFTPVNEEEIDILIEWSLFVVQFEEANENRTKEALKLLSELQDHLLTSKFAAMYDITLDNIDKPSEEQMILFDTNTKSCDCYEYEQSGDCHHFDDV